MNVLIVAPDVGVGGVASVVKSLAGYLRSRGHNVRMLYPGSSVLARYKASRLGLHGTELRLQAPLGERHPAVSLPAFAILFPIGLVQLLWCIFRWRIQVVNLQYTTDDLFYFGLCRRVFHFTLVCSIHGADLFPSGKLPAKCSRGMHTLLQRADRIVTPSAYCRNKLLEIYPEYAAKTVFIHNGIDIREASKEVQHNDPSPEMRYVLSVSAYKEQKALDVLIRAMERVSTHNPDVKLILVGAGPLRRDLESLSERLGLAHCIEFHGSKSHDEVMKLVRGCAAFVLPSRFESFGIAIVEAMACGRPVVVANAGGMPEVVRNGVTGFLVDPENPSRLADSLNALLGDPMLARRIGKNAAEEARARFDVAAMGSAYERVFNIPNGK